MNLSSKFRRFSLSAAATVLLIHRSSLSARAEGPPTNTRYGVFNLLDSRSKYGTNWFPEPLHTDEMDADQEFRLNYFHAETKGRREDEASLEIEKSFGLLTLEIEVPYEREVETEDGQTSRSEGIGSVELSARHPVFQYVSPDEFFDYTLGARVELAIPTGSDVSKNTELVGGLYQTIALGEHFSVQTSVAYSRLFGPNEDRGAEVIEYSGVFGYNIEMGGKFLAIARVTPIFEIDGETALNHAESGTTSLTGAAGALINFESIGIGQPKLLIGYVFPLNDTARDEMDWGITTSLLLEY
jgi:hypothetical protein